MCLSVIQLLFSVLFFHGIIRLVFTILKNILINSTSINFQELNMDKTAFVLVFSIFGWFFVRSHTRLVVVSMHGSKCCFYAFSAYFFTFEFASSRTCNSSSLLCIL